MPTQEQINKMNILTISVSDHIGQVLIEDSNQEIKRLESQFPDSSWEVNFSKWLYEYDSTEDGHNPTELSEGYCWVIRKQ